MNHPPSNPDVGSTSPAALLRKIVTETNELYKMADSHQPIKTPQETLRFFNNGSLSVSGDRGALQIYEGKNGKLEVAASVGAQRASWILESYDDELAGEQARLLQSLADVVADWRTTLKGLLG